jgi:isopenicillin N synthase-like dioxygenase
MKTNAIPIVDFEGYLNGDTNVKLRVSKELIHAMQSCGFVYLKNFGIKNEEVAEIFKLSKDFFQLPNQLKASVKKSHETFCGYDQIELEKLSEDRTADYKESYMVKQNGTPWPLFGENNLFKEKMLAFHKKCFNLGFSIFTSILSGLEVDPILFDNQFSKGECTILRLLHYPPLPESAPLNQLWCGEV